MRIHAGMMMVRSLLLVVVSASWACAQPPGQWATPLEQAETFAPPTDYCPPGTYTDYGASPPEAAFPPQAGYGAAPPGEAYPWPAISPFDHRFDQVSQEKGLWHRFINDSPRKFYGGIDWLKIYYQKPGGAGNEPDKQVGFPVRLATSGPLLQTGEDEFQDLLLDGNQFSPPLVGILGAGTFSPRQPINDPTRITRWSFYEDDFDTNGFEGFWGYTDPDDTGVEISGFLGAKQSQEMDSPLRAIRQGVTLVNGSSSDISLIINRVKTADGTISQVPLVFVTSLSINYEAQAWGAEANVYTTPLLGRGNNKIRGMYGLRYMGVHEQFDLVGIDQRPGETDLFILTPRELQAVDSGFGGNYGGNTFVQTWVDTHLVGPQIGLQWDLGGDKFKLKSFANFGAMANLDKTRITALNYGAVPGPGLNVIVEENHSHLSPLVELGLQGDIPLFQYLPLVNKIPIVRDATLRAGYKHTWVFLMSRPADSITWGDPAPVIDGDREEWSVRSANVGMQWTW